MDIHYHFRSFREAINGLKHAFSEHPNFRIHLLLSILVIFLAFYYQINRIEMLIIILTIVIGFTVEFLNTAIESVCDLVTLEWRKDIKIAKDVGAAMMLITALGSVIIGLLVFYPYIF
ncbi:MAG: diacylglycerol kinase family protein [Patescibacteria group bacterium]|nr:diacylglycerol kinase family protein [Patescibacteria group bacterium]